MRAKNAARPTSPSDRKRNGNFTFAPTATGSSEVSGSGIGAATFMLGLPTLFERFVLAATDMSLSKRFQISEHKGLALRWDAFNLFNRTNMGNPNTSIDAGPGNAARITALQVGATMRAMQVGLRLDF